MSFKVGFQKQSHILFSELHSEVEMFICLPVKVYRKYQTKDFSFVASIHSISLN